MLTEEKNPEAEEYDIESAIDSVSTSGGLDEEATSDHFVINVPSGVK